MTETSAPLAWPHETGQITGSGVTRKRVGTGTERAALAEALGILSVGRLDVAYTLRPSGKDRFRLAGTLEADVEQACVVTLEPVPETIRETFDIEFVPPTVLAQAATGEGEHEILSAPDQEPLDTNVIDVGRIAFEIVSAGLDPYPRKAGAEFDWTDPKEEASKAAGGAFAELAKLRKKD